MIFLKFLLNIFSEAHLLNVCLFGFSAISTQQNAPQDQHVSFSSSLPKEGAEEAGAFILDKIIQISEVTLEKTETHNFTSEDQLDSLLNPVAELEQDIPPDEINFPPDEGINGLMNTSHVKNGVFPCGHKAPENVQ